VIVTIDGPAGSGKSTAARALAERLRFRFLDTGALYRTVAHACVSRGVETSDADAVGTLAEGLSIEFDGNSVIADGVDVTERLRSPGVARAASLVALNPRVREALAVIQRDFAAGADVVTEGRDQGTIVFPHAECKFFLTADETERARRRQQDMQKTGVTVTIEEMLHQLEDRDRRDTGRLVAPLIPADDAILLNTTSLSAEQVLEELERLVKRKLANPDDS